MTIKFKGLFSPYKIAIISQWINEHLTDITIMRKPIYIYECKISKIKKHRILVEV